MYSFQFFIYNKEHSNRSKQSNKHVYPDPNRRPFRKRK